MSGIFNGSNAYLSLASSVLGSTPTYPVLISAWVKATDTSAGCVACVTDNIPIVALDMINLRTTAAAAETVRWAEGIFSVKATANAPTAAAWQKWMLMLASTSDARIKLANGAWATDTTTLAPASLTNTLIGAEMYNVGTIDLFFSGRIAEVSFASGFNINNLNSIDGQLQLGVKPRHIPELGPYIAAYQPLRTGVNETGAIGPSWTNNNVTFSATDHPVRAIRSDPHWPESTWPEATFPESGWPNGRLA